MEIVDEMDSNDWDTPPKFNSEFSLENTQGPKRTGLSSNHHFSGAMLNSRGV